MMDAESFETDEQVCKRLYQKICATMQRMEQAEAEALAGAVERWLDDQYKEGVANGDNKYRSNY
jgi:hypothetical protein